jgi:hypothetical protein
MRSKRKPQLGDALIFWHGGRLGKGVIIAFGPIGMICRQNGGRQCQIRNSDVIARCISHLNSSDQDLKHFKRYLSANQVKIIESIDAGDGYANGLIPAGVAKVAGTPVEETAQFLQGLESIGWLDRRARDWRFAMEAIEPLGEPPIREQEPRDVLCPDGTARTEIRILSAKKFEPHRCQLCGTFPKADGFYYIDNPDQDGDRRFICPACRRRLEPRQAPLYKRWQKPPNPPMHHPGVLRPLGGRKPGSHSSSK